MFWQFWALHPDPSMRAPASVFSSRPADKRYGAARREIGTEREPTDGVRQNLSSAARATSPSILFCLNNLPTSHVLHEISSKFRILICVAGGDSNQASEASHRVLQSGSLKGNHRNGRKRAQRHLNRTRKSFVERILRITSILRGFCSSVLPVSPES